MLLPIHDEHPVVSTVVRNARLPRGCMPSSIAVKYSSVSPLWFDAGTPRIHDALYSKKNTWQRAASDNELCLFPCTYDNGSLCGLVPRVPLFYRVLFPKPNHCGLLEPHLPWLGSPVCHYCFPALAYIDGGDIKCRRPACCDELTYNSPMLRVSVPPPPPLFVRSLPIETLAAVMPRCCLLW